MDDVSDEVLEIYEDDSSSDTGGSGSGSTGGPGGAPGNVVEQSEPLVNPVLVIIFAGLLVLVVGLAARRSLESPIEILAVVAGTVALEAFLVSEIIFPGVFTIPASNAIREIIPAVAFIVAVAVIYRWWKYVD